MELREILNTSYLSNTDYRDAVESYAKDNFETVAKAYIKQLQEEFYIGDIDPYIMIAVEYYIRDIMATAFLDGARFYKNVEHPAIVQRELENLKNAYKHYGIIANPS